MSVRRLICEAQSSHRRERASSAGLRNELPPQQEFACIRLQP